MYPSLDIKIN